MPTKRNFGLKWLLALKGTPQKSWKFGISIAFVQIALSPTSSKNQQLELKNGYFRLTTMVISILFLLMKILVHKLMLKWGALPQSYLQVTPLIRSTSNVIVQVYILIRGYQEQDQLNEITTKDHSKFRNIDTRAYLIFCYSFSCHNNFPNLRNAGLYNTNAWCKYYFFSSHNNFPPPKNAGLY